MQTFRLGVKQASRLETLIIEEIDYSTRVLKSKLFSKASNLDTAIELGTKAVDTITAKLRELRSARFAIREAKQLFNAESGINDRTIKIANLLDEKAYLEDIVLNHGEVSSVQNYNGAPDQYTLGLSEEVYEVVRTEIKSLTRRISKLKDSCAGINNQGYINVEGETKQTLQKYGLLE